MNNNQADGFDDLLVLMEYTMDDLFTMFKKWIVSIGGGDEDKGRVVFRSIVDYLSDEYKTTAKKDISIHYLMRLLVVLRDRFPDNVSKADVMRWDSKHNVIPNLSLLDDVLKSKKYLRLALEYSPYMKEEEEDVYDYVEPLSEDEIKKILEKLDRFHQIKTEKDFIDILNIIEKCHEALEIWEEGSKLSGEETSTAIIYTVKNYYHAVTLGKGSKWCITQNHHYTNYASQCNLYVIIPKEGKKYSTTKAGDVTEKYALAIHKDLYTLKRIDKSIRELREEYNYVDDDVREFLTELSPVDSHKDDKELFALIPFFMPKENLNMFNFLLHSFYDGVFNLSPYLMELPDYFAEFLKLNTIQGVEEASLRGIITKAFGVFIKNSPYNNTNLDDAMFNLLTRNLDADNIASIIWSMDYWKFIEQLATSIYYTFDDDHVDFNAMANMIYRVYNNNYGTFKSVNEQISFIEDDLYSVVEDSERDIIIYELNDEQNSPVPIERVRKYIDNEQFIEEMKKAESLVWLSDFFENGRIDSQSIVWEMLEGYAEHLGRIYEKEPYRSLIHLFLNIKNKKKDIKGNVALSVFLTASEKNKEVLKEFCKEFSKRAVLKNITYEHFEHPFLNECQEILSSGEEKEA